MMCQPAKSPETEITPAMIAAAVPIFEEWLSDNGDVIREMGGSGDYETLFASLWDCWKNVANSCAVIPKA